MLVRSCMRLATPRARKSSQPDFKLTQYPPPLLSRSSRVALTNDLGLFALECFATRQILVVGQFENKAD